MSRKIIHGAIYASCSQMISQNNMKRLKLIDTRLASLSKNRIITLMWRRKYCNLCGWSTSISVSISLLNQTCNKTLISPGYTGYWIVFLLSRLCGGKMFPLHENQDKSAPESFPSNLIVDGKWKCIFLNIIVNKFRATSVSTMIDI